MARATAASRCSGRSEPGDRVVPALNLRRPREITARALSLLRSHFRMKNSLKLLAAAVAAGVLTSQAGSLPPETPVIVDGNVTVDAGDIEGYLLRVPADRRAELRGSRDRIAAIAD